MAKTTTLEVVSTLHTTVPVKGVYLTNTLETTARNIVNHVAGVAGSDNTIARAVLHFKVDALDRLCFLYCASLRLISESSAFKDHNFRPLYTGGNECLPPFVRSSKTHTSTYKPVSLQMSERCPHCERATEPNRLH